MVGPMLMVDDIHVYYGNIAAVKGLTITVEQGEIVTLLGSNGAGKSTTLRTVSGLLRPRKGSVTFNGRGSTPCRRTMWWDWAWPRHRRDGASSRA
jgi:branched-chain amino acid transport system ATP-binding protein